MLQKENLKKKRNKTIEKLKFVRNGEKLYLSCHQNLYHQTLHVNINDQIDPKILQTASVMNENQQINEIKNAFEFIKKDYGNIINLRKTI